MMNDCIEPTLLNSSEQTRLFHIPEPRLTFGYNQKLVDPRDGLILFGPFSRDKLSGQLNIGIIGPSRQRSALKRYLNRLHSPIYGDNSEIARPFFPGIETAFCVFVNFSSLKEIDVPYAEITKFGMYSDGHQRIHNLCNLYTERLISYQEQEEVPINVWFVIIPDDIYRYGRPQSHIPSSEDNIRVGLSRSERKANVISFFDEFNQLKVAYDFEMNFHNQLKAKLLTKQIVTQIIRESTIDYENIWTNQQKITMERKFDTAKAWNISTTLYYKTGGLPWRLGDVREKVCYLGLIYKKLHPDGNDKNACCAAQMFLDSGDGVVFRGNIGPWYNPGTREYHIKQSDAFDLLNKALESFKEKSPNRDYPNEVFIHAKTYFDDEEWEGFLQASHNKSQIVGVRIRENMVLKLYRDFSYCVPRGTVLRISDTQAYLWSKGFIPRIQTQLGLETPNPLDVEISRGHCEIEVVCKDVLALTKLNYNACTYGDGLPVTLRFADSIGEVLTAGRNVESGILPFKHYV